MKNIKKIFLLSILIFLANSELLSQETENIETNNIRTNSIYFGFGTLEIINFGINHQLNEKYSLGFGTNIFFLGDGNKPRAALGISIKGVYYFSTTGNGNFLWTNMISTNLSYLLPARKEDSIGGIGFETLIGSDRIIGKGVGINWGVGISMGTHDEEGSKIFPAFKLGFHLDL